LEKSRAIAGVAALQRVCGDRYEGSQTPEQTLSRDQLASMLAK